MGKFINIAKLKKGDLEKIESLEKKLGVCLLGYNINDGPDIYSLRDNELKEVQELEKLLGISLVAYKKDNSGAA